MSCRSDRLERILRVRQLQEEQARGVWLPAEIDARDAEDRTEALQQAGQAMTSQLSTQLASLSPAWILMAHGQIDSTGRRKVDQQERAATLRVQAEAARHPWTESRAAARGLERLVERLRSEERLDDRAQEGRQLDELSMARLTEKPRSKQR